MQTVQQRSILDTQNLLKRLGLSDGMRVADFGSGGHGHYVRPMAERVGKQGTIYIVDVRSGPLSALHSQMRQYGHDHVVPVRADVEVFGGTGLVDEHCHRVTMVNMLHQALSPQSALREAARVLHPTGLLLVIDWEKSLTGIGPTAGNFLLSDVVVAAAEENGLILVQHFNASPVHYGLLFAKK